MSWNDYYVISQYDEAGMLYDFRDSWGTFTNIEDARKILRTLKNDGVAVAQDQYTEGVFICKRSYRSNANYTNTADILLSIHYL